MTDHHWQHFPHDADLGIRGFGDTLSQAFEQAATAMMAGITNLDEIAEEESVSIHCEAPDNELLLVDWLNAVIYETATRKMLFARFEVEIEGKQLTATAWGERIDVGKHHPAVEPKGATQTHLRVARRPNGTWVTECVVDV